MFAPKIATRELTKKRIYPTTAPSFSQASSYTSPTCSIAPTIQLLQCHLCIPHSTIHSPNPTMQTVGLSSRCLCFDQCTARSRG